MTVCKIVQQNSQFNMHGCFAFYLTKFQAEWKYESFFSLQSTDSMYTSTLLSPKPSGLFLRLLVLLILLRLFRWRVEGPESCRWRLALLPTTTLSSSQKLLSPQRTILSALSYNIEALAIWLSIIVKTMYAGSDGIRVQLYAISFTSHSALISL